MIKRFLLTIILAAVIFLPGFGQATWGNPLGQYTYNPAGGAMSDVGELISGYYSLHGSANNSPLGYLLMGTTTFPNNKIAAGFKFTSETGGVLSNFSGEATFIYKTDVCDNSKLSFGLSGTINKLRLMKERLNPQHPADPILIAGESGFWGDANLGVNLYRTNVYYVGISANNLLAQQTGWRITDFKNQSSRLFTLSGMYTFNLSQGAWKWELSGVVMTYNPAEFGAMVYDAGTRFIYRKSFWVGSRYSNNTVKGLFGIYFQNLAVGYCGGMSMGDVTAYTYAMTRHEIFLRMELNTSKPSKGN